MKYEYLVKRPDNIGIINTNDVGELLWWSFILDTCPEKIITATHTVGYNTEVVRKFIKGS